MPRRPVVFIGIIKPLRWTAPRVPFQSGAPARCRFVEEVLAAIFVDGIPSPLISDNTTIGMRSRLQLRRVVPLAVWFLSRLESNFLRRPSHTQSVQDEVVCKTQVGGVSDDLVCISNAGVLCDAPELVTNDSITMPTSQIRAVFVAVQ
jgi:hypothetical protein